MWSDAHGDPVGFAASQAASIMVVSMERINQSAWRQVGSSFDLVVSQPAARCHYLAKMARAMLNGRNVVGRLAATAFESSADDHETGLVNALARRIPLPGTSELVLVGRVLQLAGICLCRTNSIPLSQCPCLIDIVEVDGRRLVTSVLSQGKSDWRSLAELVPVPA